MSRSMTLRLTMSVSVLMLALLSLSQLIAKSTIPVSANENFTAPTETPCPTSGEWPDACSPVVGPGDGSSGTPCPAVGEWPDGCVPITITPTPAVTTATTPTPMGDNYAFNLLGQFDGRIHTVFVEDDTAYIDIGFNLVTLDVSDPTNPTGIVKSEPLPQIRPSVSVDNIVEIEVVENIAYVVTARSGLAMVDVSDPAAPVLLGAIEIPDDGVGSVNQSNGVAVVGNRAYISSREFFAIVDVSNPAAPSLIGSFEFEDSYSALWGDVQLVGDVAYIISKADLLTMDVSDPTNPVPLASIEVGSVSEMELVDGIAYMSSLGRLATVDVTDPATPILLGSIDTGGSTSGIAGETGMYLVGDIAYIGAGTNGLMMIDVSDPASPHIHDFFSMDGFVAYDVYVADDVIYVTGYEDGLYLFEYGLERPTTPAVTATPRPPLHVDYFTVTHDVPLYAGEPVTVSWSISGLSLADELELAVHASVFSMRRSLTADEHVFNTIAYVSTNVHELFVHNSAPNARPFEGVPLSATLDVECRYEWFMLAPGESRHPDSTFHELDFCPTRPQLSNAIQQEFEHGTMIWIEEVGEILVIEPVTTPPPYPYNGSHYTRPYEDTYEEGVDPVSDSSLVPPDGMFQPEHQLGKAWREQAMSLGWATEPPVYFETVKQYMFLGSTRGSYNTPLWRMADGSVIWRGWEYGGTWLVGNGFAHPTNGFRPGLSDTPDQYNTVQGETVPLAHLNYLPFLNLNR